MDQINKVQKEIKANEIKKITFKPFINNKNNYIIGLYNETENINYFVLDINQLNKLFNQLVKLSENILLSKEFMKEFIKRKNILYL